MRWILPVVLVVGAYVVWRSTAALHWREIAPGVEFAILRGEPWCRRGSAAIAVVRLDPERVRVRVNHWSQTGADHPLDVVEWQQHTHAVAVFNAGQFYPDYRYMGLLSSGGRWFSKRAHPGYQALLVADRRGPGGGGGAQILDLSDPERARDSLAWKEVAQSFMLFDSSGTLRVRRSERIANRTVVAEDRHHRLLVLVSEGSYTLADFAFVLQNSPLQLTHAMSMDGGREAELVVARGAFRYASFGPWLDSKEHPDALSSRTPLPAVISVELP
ncbi:MAG: phosphodiester glycosidase family protein [Candidatus Eisenbacteria bacterium]